MEVLNEQTVKGYELKECLGEGAYGAVYRALQPQVGREVAIKVILPEFANRPEFIRRFEAEAQLVAQLEHMNIVPLYDYWREPDGAYLVMRLMKGGSLADSLRESGLWEPMKAAKLVDQIAAALDAAHQQGVVHRDLKPANILLDESGNAYLSDFGIAKELGAEVGLTQTGAIVGTPAYITPEQVQSQTVTPQTDIYALGVVLYELLTGEHPFADAPTGTLIIKHVNEPLPMLREKRPELPVEVDQVIQKATAKDPAARFPDTLTMAADFRRALQLEVALPAIPEGEIYNPYKGLRAFQEADADDFFGRETLTEQLLARLVSTASLEGMGRFLAVVGPSGSGKSSVVKAGLLPALRKGGLPGSERWFITEMVPSAYPLEELELALLRIAVKQPPSLLEQLEKDERGLLRAARRVLPEDGELFLVVDQLEEVFTLVGDPKQSAFFLQSLYEAVVDPRSPMRVVVTLRADFYDRPLIHPDFSTLIQKRTEVVVPLTSEELERAIRAPVERVGVVFERGLVPHVIADVVDQPGALPLLQYALTELFERREGRMLTHRAYQSIGGVLGALGRRAEEVYGGLAADGKECARQLFLRLVALGEGTEDTRRRVLRSELESLFANRQPVLSGNQRLPVEGSLISNILDTFGQTRLLTFDRDPLTRGSTVEVAHEALLREWHRLREWLYESRTDVRMQRVLANAAAEWLEAGRDSGFLLRGSRMDQFAGWSATTDLALTQTEQNYLESSLAERKERQVLETARRQRELEQVSIGLASQAIQELEGAAPERSVLLAMEALEHYPYTWQAERALGQSVLKNRLRQCLTHNDTVFTAQWSTDGKKILSGSRDRTVRLWDAISGEELMRITEGAPTAASWSPDERSILAVNEEDVIVKIWDTEAGFARLTLSREEIEGSPNINTIGWNPWSPSGDRFLIYTEEGALHIWDAQTGAALHTLSEHKGCISQAMWSPSGDSIATSGFEDGMVILLQAESGDVLHRITADFEDEKVIVGGWSPDGKQFATRGMGGAKVYEAATGRQLLDLSVPGVWIFRVVWSPDGSRILTTGGADGTARVWDANSGQELSHIAVFGEAIAADWSSTGKLAAVGGDNGVVNIWDKSREFEIFELSGPKFLRNVAFSPNDKYILAVGIKNTVNIYALSEAKFNISIPIGNISNVAWSPSVKQFACRYREDGDIKIWESSNGQEALSLSGHDEIVWCIAWSPSGDRILTASADKTIKIWDAITGELLLTLSGHEEAVLNASWSPDGSRIVSNDWSSNKVVVWDTATGEKLLTFSGHHDWATWALWSPDGEHILSTSSDGGATIWEAATGKVIIDLLEENFSFAIYSAAWSKDGRQILLLCADNILRIFDAVAGEQIKQFTTQSVQTAIIKLTSTGERILISGEGSARILDFKTGSELLSYGEYGGFVEISESPDGSFVLIGCTSGTLQVFPAWHSAEDLITYAKEHCVFRELTPEERELFGLPER